MLYPAG